MDTRELKCGQDHDGRQLGWCQGISVQMTRSGCRQPGSSQLPPPHPSLPEQGFSFKLSHRLWSIVWMGVPACTCLLLSGSKLKASDPQAQEETPFCKHPAPKTTGLCVRASARLSAELRRETEKEGEYDD